MTKERARELYNIPDDEEIPDFVKYLPDPELEPQLPLSGKDLAWAKGVAARWAEEKSETK